MGDILVLAERYRNEGADEVVFYDITASPEGRSVDRNWVSRVAGILDIPFCVAGGIRSVEDAEAVLNAGAEKISINSPAIANPGLIEELASRFGSQCVVIGIDSANLAEGYRVFQFTGDPNRSRNTGRDTLSWVREVQDRGAGEIVLNCMTNDGVRRGYDVTQLKAVRAVCDVPLVASGGAGAPEHFVMCSKRPAWMPRWLPACFTPERSPSPISRPRSPRRASRCAYEFRVRSRKRRFRQG